ncbi:unnamed protein product [Linum trigynum]|uniref:Transposase MuDR plant domain-containing protein n=1 Tax=Linum trigynum TaxID=586398 RepID=A0AAV2CJP8_9ROSI
MATFTNEEARVIELYAISEEDIVEFTESDGEEGGVVTKGKKTEEADSDYDEEDDSDYKASEEEDFSFGDNLQFEKNLAADVEADFFSEEGESSKGRQTIIDVDSDDRRTIYSSDEDDDNHEMQEFRAGRDIKSPTFTISKIFGKFDLLKEAIKQYAFVEKRHIHFKKNDKKRLQAVCANPCDWCIWVSRMSLTNVVQIKKCKLQHSKDCQRTFKVKFATAKFLGGKVARKMEADKNMSKGLLKQICKEDYKEEVVHFTY